MTRLILFLLFWGVYNLSAFDISKEYLLVYFKDKPPVSQEVLQAQFTPQSIERREKQGLSFDFFDLPIHSNYVEILREKGLDVADSSRWLNAALIAVNKKDKAVFNLLDELDFVVDYQHLGGKSRTENANVVPTVFYKTEVESVYELVSKSISLDTLHSLGFNGQGIHIALLDAGFVGVDTFSAFSHIIEDEKIIHHKDFTSHLGNAFSGSVHGTRVFSIFSVLQENKLLGMSTGADFSLLKTESSDYEHPIEEFFFVKALEFCDVQGVDIVNASLGYNYFDNHQYSYYKGDLYTGCSISSRASEFAASRGMLVVTSAGNEGNLRWKEITIPADAKNIIAVGTTNVHGSPVSYSSYGRKNVAQPRPNLAAPGHKVYSIDRKGAFSLSYGSSYAAPVISAAAACLWQYQPDLTVFQIIDLMERSASHYENPQLQIGYGLPNMKKVIELIKSSK